MAAEAARCSKVDASEAAASAGVTAGAAGEGEAPQVVQPGAQTEGRFVQRSGGDVQTARCFRGLSTLSGSKALSPWQPSRGRDSPLPVHNGAADPEVTIPVGSARPVQAGMPGSEFAVAA